MTTARTSRETPSRAISRGGHRACRQPTRVTGGRVPTGVVAEGSKPPSVRSGIQLSVRTSVQATMRSGLAPVRVRRSIRSPRLPGVRSRSPRRVNAPSLPSRSLGVRTPHRSRGVVSFLFQSRRSPAPGLHPVTCPDGGGTFLVGHGSRTPSATSRYTPDHPKGSVTVTRRPTLARGCRSDCQSVAQVSVPTSGNRVPMPSAAARS